MNKEELQAYWNGHATAKAAVGEYTRMAQDEMRIARDTGMLSVLESARLSAAIAQAEAAERQAQALERIAAALETMLAAGVPVEKVP